MVRVDEFDQDLMRSGGKTIDDERLAACVGPTPRRIVHGHMDVADTRRYIQGCRAEHLDDAQVLGAVLDDDPPMGKRVRQRGSMTIFAAGSLASGTTPAGPRMSLAD